MTLLDKKGFRILLIVLFSVSMLQSLFPPEYTDVRAAQSQYNGFGGSASLARVSEAYTVLVVISVMISAACLALRL